MGLYDQRLLDLSVPEDLDWQSHPLYQSCVNERLRSNRALCGKISQTFHVHNGIFFSKRIPEPVLRDSANERHLPTFKSRLLAPTGSRQESLVPLRGCITVSRSRTSADPLALFLGSFSWSEFVQVHCGNTSSK